MTDIEQRLRAAMAAADGPPPARLMEGIRRRHRRHRRRTAAVGIAAVAAIAVAGPAIAGTGPFSLSPAARPAWQLTRGAAPGTVLRDCSSENYSDLGPDWKARSVRAGPLWFVYAKQGMSNIIAVRAGATAVLRVDPRARSRFAFLPDTAAGPGQGKPGITFRPCPASYLGPVTIWWITYLDRGLSCIPLQVAAPQSGRIIAREIPVASPSGLGSCAG